MAYRELHVVEVKEQLRLWTAGRSIRFIAANLKLDRKTVHRYVEKAQELGLKVGDKERALSDEFVSNLMKQLQPGAPSKHGVMWAHCEIHREMVKGWLKEGVRGPKIRKLLHRKTNTLVPLRTLQRFIRIELKQVKRATVAVVNPEPVVLEIDFLEFGTFTELATGKVRKLHGLICTPSVSRYSFLFPCLNQNLESVIDGLEAAWKFYGGVFKVVLPDNPKAIINHAHPTDSRINRKFLHYSQSRDFVVDAARVRRPKDKARVRKNGL